DRAGREARLLAACRAGGAAGHGALAVHVELVVPDGGAHRVRDAAHVLAVIPVARALLVDPRPHLSDPTVLAAGAGERRHTEGYDQGENDRERLHHATSIVLQR